MSGTALDSAVACYVLALGDDALVCAQRLCEWATRAPAIEEDVALMNIALDLLGQARSLLAYAGELEGSGRREDELAYLRDERDFRNCQLVELDNGDFATTMARQLLFSAYQFELYGALSSSTDERLSGVAAKAVKQVAYHREHAAGWVVRLGDGTQESHARMAAALGTAALLVPSHGAMGAALAMLAGTTSGSLLKALRFVQLMRKLPDGLPPAPEHCEKP